MIGRTVTIIPIGVVLALLAAAGCEDAKPVKRRASNQSVSEVAATFSELATREEQYVVETGEYLSTGGEGDLASAPGPTWKKLGVRGIKAPLECKYGVMAGRANEAPSGPLGRELFAGETPTRAWFYLVADCDGLQFMQRGGSNEIVERKPR